MEAGIIIAVVLAGPSAGSVLGPPRGRTRAKLIRRGIRASAPYREILSGATRLEGILIYPVTMLTANVPPELHAG